ncbi:MAG: EAL domain-containing protein [Gammaproteobacteria bacterium]|nr:EAL domain-containing protein [Gammaproteobacteria bacterium]
MSKEKSVNLIVIDDSFNNEEKLVSIIRGLGSAARSVRVEDDEDLEEALKKTTPDLVIYNLGMELIDLPGVMKILTGHELTNRTAVLAASRDGQTNDINLVMSQGANDLIDMKNDAHLKNVLSRELKQLANNRRLFQLESAYIESEKRCDSLLDSSRDAIAYIHEGMHIYSNQSYLELFGFEETEDLEGTPILDMVGRDDQDRFKKFLRGYSNSSGIANLECNLKNADSTEFKGKIEFSPASIDGEPCIQIIIRNEVDQKELEKQINMLSQRDQVTGLYNRQFFIDSLEKTIAKSKKDKTESALLYLSLDGFHELKDKLGVIGSDQLLIDVAERLQKVCDDNDILSRFHGHDFTIIHTDSSAEESESYAARLQNEIQQFSTTINGIATKTTCTIGISLIEQEPPESSEILLRAEKAAEQSQKQGPNTISVYVPKEGELTQKEIDSKVSGSLMTALKNNMFVLYYQPVISLHGDTEERYEVYVRMKDKTGELIMPDEFMPAAERSGLMTAIDRWVIEHALSALLVQKKANKHTKFFIKLSETSLRDEAFLPWLEEKLQAANINKHSIIFEIKESTAVTNLKQTKILAEGLAALDCSFALDDFGTGLNPFQLLKHIPVDYLKIESSFMENLSTNTQNQETVKNITETATKMNKLTIAQCIHDASSLSVLWGMGVNFIQGNFLQEPVQELDYDFTEMTG